MLQSIPKTEQDSRQHLFSGCFFAAQKAVPLQRAASLILPGAALCFSPGVFKNEFQCLTGGQ